MTTIYEPAGNARVLNSAHRFSAVHMGRSARQAAKAAGLATVGSYEIVCHVQLTSPEDANADIVVIRAFSPAGRKMVELTAGDLYLYDTEYQDAPSARVR